MPIEIEQLEQMLGGEWLEKLPPICLYCGYDLTGLPDNRCPECGRVFLRREVQQQARRMRSLLLQLRNCDDLLRVGLYIGVTGAALMVTLYALGFWHAGFRPFGRAIGLCSGFPAMALGLQVLRIKRLPAWAQACMEHKPDVMRGIGLAILGAAMVIGGVVPF